MGKNACQTATRVVVLVLLIVGTVLSGVSLVTPIVRLTFMELGNSEPRVTWRDIGVGSFITSSICQASGWLLSSFLMDIISIATTGVAVILMIPLLVIQACWSCGHKVSIKAEKGLGITTMVFVVLSFVCDVGVFATATTAWKTIERCNSLGDGFNSDPAKVVSSRELKGGFFTILFAMLALLAALVLVAIPDLFGIEWACRGCPGYGNNSKKDQVERELRGDSNTELSRSNPKHFGAAAPEKSYVELRGGQPAGPA